MVLGGGVFRNRWAPFFERIDAGVHAVAPRASIVRLTAPPLVGAAMLGLDLVGATRAATPRARASLTHERLAPQTRSPEGTLAMAEIVLDRITKVFGDVIAVNDVSLEIPDGEFMVLVGPSGCGKSTILRMIAGLEEVTAGEISIDG